MTKPTVDQYILFVGLREAVAQSSLINPTTPTREDIADAAIEYAINLAQSEVLSYLGDRYTKEELDLADGLSRMILQIARWNLDQRIEPRDFVHDQYLSVLDQLKAIAAHEAGLWLQALPSSEGSSGSGGTSGAIIDPSVPPSTTTSFISFGGGDPGFNAIGF